MTRHAEPGRVSGIVAQSLCAVAGAMLAAPLAAEPAWQLGTRFTVLAADAPPANDMPGWGLVARRALAAGSRWRVGVALDRFEFDHEEPYKSLGIPLPGSLEAIDAVNESTVASAFLERHYGSEGARNEWFWSAGAGYASVDTPAVVGPVAGGGRFDIRTEAQDELHLLASAGFRRRFGERFGLELALHAQHQMLDYRLRDAVTGREARISDQTPLGISVGIYASF